MLDYTEQIDFYLKRLFPICRSITGEGNRETLRILQEIIPLIIKEYPTGQQVYDWTIPKEWNIKDAWIKNSRGEKIVDFKCSNLHVVSYSVSVHKTVQIDELKPHLHFLEHLPEAIPYRTSYYKEDWGFCLSYNDYQCYFNDGDIYEVFIDSELKNGSLTVGELLIEGKSKKEYLISTYICHPSLANDNLSGVIMTAFLGKELQEIKNNFSYRIIFVPETIGAIAYCANNEKIMKKIKTGFVVSCVGGPGKYGYKQSFNKEHWVNRFIEQTFHENRIQYRTYPFDIHGSDERQYASPGFRMNTPSICKDKYYEYEFYHTSLDNLNFINAETINDTLDFYLQIMEKLDKNLTYEKRIPECEVMLSRQGLYPKEGGGLIPGETTTNELDTLLWLLFYCDGRTSLFEISEILHEPMNRIYELAFTLEEKKILVRTEPE